MAFFWILLIELVGCGLLFGEEIGTRKINETATTSKQSNSKNNKFFWQLASEIMDYVKSRRKVDEPLVGQNEFQLVLSRNRRHRLPMECSQNRSKRVKRNFVALPCAANDKIRIIDGKNDFESGTTPREWLRNRWDEVREDLVDNEEVHPEDCLPERFLQAFESFRTNLTQKEMSGGGRAGKKGKGGGKKGKDKEKGKDKDKDNDEEDGLQETVPSDFIKEYASERQTGCGCSLSHESIGCVCCLHFEEWDIIICAGCGYVFEEFAFVIRITVEDFTLFSWEKEIAKASFSKYLEIFSKSLCIPHQFSAIINACLELSINFSPSFKKEEHSIIAACPRIVAQAFLFWEEVLLSLPCWELEFDLPFLRIAGKPPMAKLTFENGTMKLNHPVKRMFASEDIKDISKLVKYLGQMERNLSHTVSRRYAGSRMVQNIGEEPKLLKRGNATIPINWNPTKMSELHYMVVLYTQPLSTPLSKDDLNDDAIKNVPGFHSMTLDAMDRRLPDVDPSIINLKVHASLAHSCGGVILTKDKILTLCACIKLFYLFHKYRRKLMPEDRLDVFTLASKDIYVTHADRSFTANQIIYELVQNPKLFMKKSKCFNAIERSIKKVINDAKFTDTHMHSVVMSVTRDFKTFDKLSLVPFLDMGGTRSTSTPAEMTVIGMRKSRVMDIFDAQGWEFDPLYEVVKVPFVSCPETRFCKLYNPTGDSKGSVLNEFDEHTECFCAKEPGFHLCDGVVGFPVITKQGLIGLNAIPMHCKEEGSMVVALFSKASIKEINDHLKEPDAEFTEPTKSEVTHHNPNISCSPVVVAAFFLTTCVSLSVFVA